MSGEEEFELDDEYDSDLAEPNLTLDEIVQLKERVGRLQVTLKDVGRYVQQLENTLKNTATANSPKLL